MALAQPESAYTLGHRTPVHKEFLAGALHQVASLKGKQTLTPEPKEPVLATTILQSTLAGGTFKLPTLETQLPELYMALAMSAEANTTIMTQNPPDALAPSNGNSLLGSLPKSFDGNRDIAKEFIHFYKRWWRLNDKKPAFKILYKRVALCISYIHGKKVKDWADDQQEAMDKKLTSGYTWLDEELWEDFAKSFNDTFTDIAAGVKVENELQTLRMKDGNIDTYIATFKKLLKEAGYTENEQGTLKMFKSGLPGGLNICIINNSLTLPNTLKSWIEAAHQQQLKYLQTKEYS